MNRRRFLRNGGAFAFSWALARGFREGLVPMPLMAAEREAGPPNPNWASRQSGATVKASTFVADPPWGYAPANVFGDNLYLGWEAEKQTGGAWLEIAFPQGRSLGELWILPEPRPRHMLGQEPYMLTYSRAKLLAAPRRIRCTASDGTTVKAELLPADYFQIIALPKIEDATSLRITVDDVWKKPGSEETGLSKVRIYPRPHERTFQVDAYSMYDVQEGKPMQAATLHLINPGAELKNAQLLVSREGSTLARITLKPIPAAAAVDQDVWIPAPFEDTAMQFKILVGDSAVGPVRKFHVPAYKSYFDRGVFALNCTCHNDLGWLNTQEKTADYRSADIILPALKLLKDFPEFRYSMECTTYLMEFLDRHPEMKDEMVARMRENRFAWGASYVQCQEVHVGPEKLVRQFYLGRRWLRKTFPGIDTRWYVKTDPPSMTLQMPQILAKAGIKYHIQGRMPFGFYRWLAPDGSEVLTYAYHYVDPMRLLDPNNNQGWLRFAQQREYYYAPRGLPPMLIYDYTSDYLPPQPELPPYVREQNEAMARFAGKWNEHYAANPAKQIHPPRMLFVQPEEFLDQFTEHPLNITTLKGDWPFSWAYYDEPGNREGLLLGREAHNGILAAERFCAGLGLSAGFGDYPRSTFAEAWRANCWPDHGWGGNQGLTTDMNYNTMYGKSKDLADRLLNDVGSKVAKNVERRQSNQIPIVVFNPLSWQRTDVVDCELNVPSGWPGFALRDDAGNEVSFEITRHGRGGTSTKIIFIAEAVPSVGYRTFCLEPARSSGVDSTPLSGEMAENQFFRVAFGPGGLKSLYDKQKKWEVLRTGKFDGGEVLQFTAPGLAWEDPEIVTMKDFDKTSHHPFPLKTFTRGPVRITAMREAEFKNFLLRQHFHLYHALDRLDIEVELLNWDGQKERELRVAFPINLDDARLSYEVPFGTVEIAKDELDFSLLPPDPDTAFAPAIYGGDHPLPYREAINWVDASAARYLGTGCLAASDCTVHLFRDETDNPVAYPILQHVLLSTRKSLAWNPEYWFTQKGDHRYRLSLMPHGGDWRLRYRDAMAFNYRLAAFVGSANSPASAETQPSSAQFLTLEPSNLVLTAMKKDEDDDRVVIRFYEAEGDDCRAHIHLSKPIRRAWRASLIEDDQEPLQPAADGGLELQVKRWEIVTLKVAV